MNLNRYLTAREEEQILPQNKLQRLAFLRGYRSAYSFGKAIEKSKIASYGTGFEKWNGKAGKTQYNTLLAIAKFLGADSVDEVFDP